MKWTVVLSFMMPLHIMMFASSEFNSIYKGTNNNIVKIPYSTTFLKDKHILELVDRERDKINSVFVYKPIPDVSFDFEHNDNHVHLGKDFERNVVLSFEKKEQIQLFKDLQQTIVVKENNQIAPLKPSVNTKPKLLVTSSSSSSLQNANPNQSNILVIFLDVLDNAMYVVYFYLLWSFFTKL